MATNQVYECEKCGEIEATHIENRAETYPVRGVEVSIIATVRVCSNCQGSIYDRELDSANIEQVYSVYRGKYHVMSGGEIKGLREKYGLSQRGLAKLLGWGEVTIHRYEQGCLPDDAHSNLLKFLQDPFNMKELAQDKGYLFSVNSYKKLMGQIESLVNQELPTKMFEVLEEGTQKRKASIYTGFKEFNPQVLREMILFCAQYHQGVLKTKLNKLLWYADFEHYRRYSVSISGASYLRWAYGAVPEHYETYLGILSDQGAIERQEKEYGEYWGELIVVTQKFLPHYLSETAQEVLIEVMDTLRTKGSKEISTLCHEEVGYQETKANEVISYTYADQLKLAFGSYVVPEPSL